MPRGWEEHAEYGGPAPLWYGNLAVVFSMRYGRVGRLLLRTLRHEARGSLSLGFGRQSWP